MESAKFLLLFIGFVETTHYSIVTPPSPATGKLGGTAEFYCEVGYGGILVMEWEFNDNRIYSIQNNKQDYPLGRNNYTVTQKGTHFTLRIDDLHFTDAGKYTCQVPTRSAAAHLIVLDTPKVLTLSPKPEEGKTTEYKCTAGFTGPSKEHISAENYPKLQMFFNDEPVNATTQEQFDGSTNYYKLVQVLNMTHDADMNEKKLMCDIGTSSPVVHVNATIKVEVLYSVRNVTHMPNREWYEIGMVINCTADGNPEPNFIWDDIENKGNYVNGNLLTITQAMVGENTWRCTARNIVGECSHQDSVSAIFEVVLPGQTPGQIQSNDASKVAMGITIPVCIAVGCLIVLFVYHHLKHNRHDDPTVMEPLLLEEGSVLPRLTIFCCDDGRKWEEKIKEIYHTKTTREVQTFNTLETLESKFTRTNSKEGTDAKDKLMIILSEGFKDHVIKYAASLTGYPDLMPKMTVLVDLPAAEIPDWLEEHNVDHIVTGKYNHTSVRSKISESIFGTTSVMDGFESVQGYNESVKNLTDRLSVGSIAESLAWAYYFSYIKRIGPTIAEDIEKFQQTKGAHGLMPKKSFILLPSSCFSYARLEDADPAIESAGKLNELHIDVAGNKRVYDPAVCKITANGKTYFACVEYCASVHVLYEMTVKLVADLSPMQKRIQLHTFYEHLNRLLKHPTLPQYCQSIELVPYDDKKGQQLSEIIVKEIEKCLKEEKSSEC